jgi:hypothetical protein
LVGREGSIVTDYEEVLVGAGGLAIRPEVASDLSRKVELVVLRCPAVAELVKIAVDGAVVENDVASAFGSDHRLV